MKGLRKLLLGSAAAALAVTAFGATPASAADTTGTIAIVNGYPGQAIDICIGPKEKSSGVPYGAYFHQKVIGTGPKLLRFYKKNNARTCGGTKIAQKWVTITPGWDKTIVVTKKDPKKVLVFHNDGSSFSGEIPPRGTENPNSWAFVRHAADFPVNISRSWWPYGGDVEVSPDPAAPAIWTKGRSYQVGLVAQFVQRINAYAVGGTDPIAQALKLIPESKRLEWILVGTWQGNAKFVVIKRTASNPSP